MDKEMREMFKLVLGKLDSLEQHVGNLEKRMDGLEHRMDNLEHRMDALEKHVDDFEKRVDKKICGIEIRLEEMQHDINACILQLDAVHLLLKRDTELEGRIVQLENWQERCRA